MATSYAETEGKITEGAGWIANKGSPFRSLTWQEVQDIREMAENTTPVFGGEANATWEQHHPIARDIFERRGLKPKV